jgi:hypothetical protein
MQKKIKEAREASKEMPKINANTVTFGT